MKDLWKILANIVISWMLEALTLSCKIILIMAYDNPDYKEYNLNHYKLQPFSLSRE